MKSPAYLNRSHYIRTHICWYIPGAKVVMRNIFQNCCYRLARFVILQSLIWANLLAVDITAHAISNIATLLYWQAKMLGSYGPLILNPALGYMKMVFQKKTQKISKYVKLCRAIYEPFHVLYILSSIFLCLCYFEIQYYKKIKQSNILIGKNED